MIWDFLKKMLGQIDSTNADVKSVNFVSDEPMKVVVGLGNPGREYDYTRHNVGFHLLDHLADFFDATEFLLHKKFDALVSVGTIGKRQVLFVKPQTYMNKSGSSIQKILSFYKLGLDDLLVMHDDLDHPFGAIKLKFRGSHGGHNGVRDTIDRVGGKKFRRLKLGIGRPSSTSYDISAFVLGKMGTDELTYRDDNTDQVREKVELWLKNVG